MVPPSSPRQILAVAPALAGTNSHAVALDLEGKVLWKHPVIWDPMSSSGSIKSCDMDGDGRKEWIVRARQDELAILGMDGRLLAILEDPVNQWMAWGVLPMPNGKGRIICAGMKEIAAFALGD